MNPSLFPSNFFTITIFILIPTVFSYTNTISYSDHCNSFAPEAIPTTAILNQYPILEPVTSHYTGGQNIFGPDSSSQRSILFTTTTNVFNTKTLHTQKIQARLTFSPSNIYQFHLNDSRFSRQLVFNLDGFWSVSTNKLCMVGSALWFSQKDKPLQLDAVLKLNFARFISLNTSLVSGTLESLASPNDYNYFDTISVIGFPRVPQFRYKYSLVSNQECDGTNGTFTRGHSVASIQSLDLCSIFKDQFKTYKFEKYPPSLPFSPSFLSLYTIQCSSQEKKLRLLVEFQDRRFTRYDQSFNQNITLIGDGTWNGTKNELCIVACHILNQTDPLGSAHVGDCSVRLTIWFPEFRSIKKTHTTEGQIWSTKKAGDDGYFETIKFQSFDHSLESYGTKYNFTKVEKVRQICPRSDVTKWERAEYASGYNGDMIFDMSVKHGNMASIGSAIPIFVGNQFYNRATPSSGGGAMNVSYEITFHSFGNSTSESERGIPLLPSTKNDKIKISAEGVYDSGTGRLCMIGCRIPPTNDKNSRNESFDCEIVVRFRFPGNSRHGIYMINGSIESLREKTDDLYFDRLTAVSFTYTKTQARETIRRMDLEIIMVLISGTLSCLFIVRQIFYIKKKPEMIPLSSVLMMLILTLGYLVPLVLNFEVMFSDMRYLQNISLGGNDGWIEVNEVIVRIVTMVAFILQFRLLQLTGSAKLGNEGGGIGKNYWNHEIRALVVCLPVYIVGGVIMLLANWKNNDYVKSSQRSIWGDLRSYAGLTLDGFLFPQVVLNIFQISRGNALSGLFYVGNTFVRLLPHAYDLYRGQKNISRMFDRFHLYANPRADFYSPSWDVCIACGGVVLAVIVFLQQRFGGRFMLPKRFRESVEYEMVPVASNE